MVRDYVTVKEVSEIFNIYEESAQELIDGIIAFEDSELQILADLLGITIEELVKE